MAGDVGQGFDAQWIQCAHTHSLDNLFCVQIIPFARSGERAHFSQMDQPSRLGQEKRLAGARSSSVASLAGALGSGFRGVVSIKNYGSNSYS